MGTEKDAVRTVIHEQRDGLAELAHDIHAHPEIGYCEEYAVERVSEFLEAQGFAVRKGVYGMSTALVATAGRGPLHIAFCAEYDALPPACLFDRSKEAQLTQVWLDEDPQDKPLRHACGHNLIAGSSVGAALGLSRLADALGLKVSLFGTPAEELFGLPEPKDGRLAPGKDVFLKAGGFDGVHAVMMMHPFPTPWSVFIPTINYPRLCGRFSKADGSGSGLDRSTLASLRDALVETVQGVKQTPALFVGRGEGEERGATAEFGWVAPSLDESMSAREAARRCFAEAAARAGVGVEVSEYARDPEMLQDRALAAAYRENSKALGATREREQRVQQEIRAVLPPIARPMQRILPHLFSPRGLFMEKFPKKVEWGTDLSTVSHIIPAIQPYVGVGPLVIPHSPEFAEHADTDEAYEVMTDAAVALAWTGVDAATDRRLRDHLVDHRPRQVPEQPGLESSKEA